MCGPYDPNYNPPGTGDIDLALRAAGQQPDRIEQSLRSVSGGRALPDRVFFNKTRAGLGNEATPPDDAFPYGGLGNSFAHRRASTAMEALNIADAFGRKADYSDPAYQSWFASVKKAFP